MYYLSLPFSLVLLSFITDGNIYMCIRHTNTTAISLEIYLHPGTFTMFFLLKKKLIKKLFIYTHTPNQTRNTVLQNDQIERR